MTLIWGNESMARIRTIKPEFWRHEDLSELSEATHLLAASLLNYADDEGYFNANHRLVKAECCPLREPSVSVQDSLNQLAGIAYVRLGTGGDGKRYGQVVHFAKHQRINRPTVSKIKEIEIDWDGSRHAHSRLTEPSPPEGNREQGRELEQTMPPDGGGVVEEGSSTEKEADASSGDRYPQEFAELWEMYREHIGEKNSSKAKAYGFWKRLKPPERENCYFGLSEYCVWAIEERKKRTDVKLKHLETFINGRNWEAYLEVLH